jgi:hypothetical protein
MRAVRTIKGAGTAEVAQGSAAAERERLAAEIGTPIKPGRGGSKVWADRHRTPTVAL